ncbi:ribosome biogenesis protein NOP53 [Anopheles ziemanni]|uniref:ribosome biogenesis protein NOP53 n=1 Tax=Anopheles coustani TaxID=139045 RepID=UPI00265ADF92|nr:ribosome biogenesis protein NOP53 [Anopheles coustani]XP_058171653.1 ribosome biogenesis protein NOP53 [Anopheles ziemanni]
MIKLGVNPVNKVAKKHVSRKLKSSWRKHIDTTEIDNFLEEKRQDERIGNVEEKPNTELFIEEAKPSRPKLTQKELRKKKFNAMPRSLQSLKNTSQVSDPTIKRNVKVPKAPSVKRNIKAAKAPVVANSVPRQAGSRKAKTLSKFAVPQKDLWEEEKLPEELRSEWVDQEQLLHTLKNTGKTLIIKQPAKMDIAYKAAAEKKHLPREGTSYNPAIDDYIQLKNEVVEQEKALLKRKAHFDRVVTNMFKMVTSEQKQRTYQEEMSEGLNKSQHSEEEDEDEDTSKEGAKVVLAKPRKRISNAKKQEQYHRKFNAKKLKQELAKLKEINRIEEIGEEINEVEQKLEKKALKRANAPPVTIDLPIDFIEPERLAGNLRTITPLNNLIATGLPKVRKVSIHRYSRAELARKKPRQKKKVRSVRRSHKITDDD